MSAKNTHKRKQALVLPPYTLKDKKQDEPFFVRVEGAMITREKFKVDNTPDLDEDGKQKIITTCLVTDVDTGETGEMVLPFLIKKALVTFVDDGGELIGTTFEIIRGKKINRTFSWAVYQVE